jgi:hypothetical protein
MEIIMAIALRSWSPVGVAMAAALVAACGSQTDTGAAVTSSTPPTNPAAVTSPAATGSPTPTPAAFGQGGGTGGRIDADALRAGKITVPPWTGPTKEIAQQCASGRLILSEPTYDTFVTELATVVFANLDGDPAVETAALIRCRYGEASEKMVVAFDRDRTGAIVMLGKLVEGHIWTVKPASGGGVTVDISDTQSCCSMSADNEFHQTRTYAWTGTAYRQTAGPTSWAGKPYVTDLVITGSPIVFGPAKDGRRMGTFTAKIRNAGKVTSGRFTLSLSELDATTTSPYLGTTGSGDCPNGCHAPLAAGASVTLTFTVSVPTSQLGSPTFDVWVYPVGVHDYGALDDSDQRSNKATLAVRLS